MIKLLRAGFFRLKKEAIFWLFVLVTIIEAVYRIQSTAHDIPLNRFLYEYISLIGICIAMFVSVFVGKEHYEGIIRNKIIVGNSRFAIYLSNLIISIVVSVLCEFIYFAFMLLIGSHIYEKLQMPISQLAMIMLNAVLIIATYCSIFNLISMMCSNATISVIICVITFIIMVVAQLQLDEIASSPKYFESTLTDETGFHIISQEPNPNYPGDDAVKLAKTIELVLPLGQANQLTSQTFTNPEIQTLFHTKEEMAEDIKTLYQMPIYSLITISIINTIGLCLFSKKELK